MSISLKKVTCQATPSSRINNSSPLHARFDHINLSLLLIIKLLISIIGLYFIFRQGSVSHIDRDVNINGRHGSFSEISVQNPRPSHHLPNFTKNLTLCYDNMLSMTAFRNEPVRYDINNHRQRQLESLRRMEESIRNRRTQSKSAKKTRNTLSIFVLDITNVLCDECSASWIPLKHSDQSGPNERILYSLVAGRGELIVFGGIAKEYIQSHPDMDEPEVYNDLHFINPPRYVI